MTEIQFLLDLLLNEKLNTTVKEKLLARIGEVEQRFTQVQTRAGSTNNFSPANFAPQAPIVTSPAVAEALASREKLLQGAGNVEAGRTSPRKF